ncbi:MAG: hypothetical protein LBS97_01400, partial [Treponema sp.]|nr:hypothetical protein [Treponema sp.]
MKKSVLTLLSLCCLAAVLPAQNSRDFNDYSLKALQTYPYTASPLVITALAFENDEQYAYTFSYTTMGLTVTGRFNLPKIPRQNIKGVILMLRGHQNEAGYYTG